MKSEFTDRRQSLLDYCRNLDLNTELWVSENETITAGDILHLVSSQQKQLELYEGVILAVQFADDLLLAKALLLFDGICKRVVLFPSNTTSELANDFIRKSNVQIYLTDSEDRLCEIQCPSKSTWMGGSLPVIVCNKLYSPDETEWVLTTSGTTDSPKLVLHSLDTLTRSIVKSSNKGQGFRWALLYELSRFAGLQVFFQTLFAGSMLVFSNRRSGFDDRIASMVRSNVNAVSATPTMWRKILMSEKADALRLKQVTLGGEIADQRILNALRRAYPNARVVHIYASTEAGVGFTVKDGRAGFPSEWLETPPADIAMRIDQHGILFLKSRIQGQRYLQDKQSQLIDDDGFICTGDIVERINDRIYFLGRYGASINVGGNKVFAEEVERVLYELPRVQLCRVSGMKSPITGKIVKAEIVPESKVINHNMFIHDVISHCRQRLESFKVPAVIKIVDALEVTGAGKVAR